MNYCGVYPQPRLGPLLLILPRSCREILLYSSYQQHAYFGLGLCTLSTRYVMVKLTVPGVLLIRLSADVQAAHLKVIAYLLVIFILSQVITSLKSFLVLVVSSTLMSVLVATTLGWIVSNLESKKICRSYTGISWELKAQSWVLSLCKHESTRK